MGTRCIDLTVRYRAFLLCLLATGVCWAAYVGWYLAGFPGRPIHVFCEIDSGGLFKQDANSLSAFAFVYVGLAITWYAARKKCGESSSSPRNLMKHSDFYIGIYALALVLLGFGTLAMHGSLTGEGAFLDVSSMYIWVCCCVCYALVRILRRGPVFFLILYALDCTGVIVGMRRGWWPVDESFGALIVLAVALELLYRGLNRKQRFENKWVMYTALSFLSGFGIWNLSLDGRPFYYPDTLFQGHALWHILCAVATWTIYRYYRSEHPVDVAANPSQPPHTTG